MQTIRVKCESVSPMLMNPMTLDTLEGIRTGTSKPKIKDRPAIEEAREKLYLDVDGITVGIPALNLYSSLVEAGRNVKNGKKQISTASSTILPSFLSIEELFLPFIDQPDWEVDMRRGVTQTGQACAIVRPRFDAWAFEVTASIRRPGRPS